MRRWTFLLIPTFSACLVLVFLLQYNESRREKLAGNGAIQDSAPVKASIEAIIQAPPEKVWGILTAINDWPKWQSGITEAAINGPLQAGATFNWTSGGTHIKSRLALVEPNQRLAWTGSAMGAHAIHVWNLERLPGGGTRVKVDESMSGLLLTLFYSSKDLEAADQLWLDRLKQQSEK
jgi:uncharacterized protein YndB with AHSA1/START domain